MDHAVPFQCSASVWPSLLLLPTPVQLVALGHETPLRIVAVEPLGFGLATIVQLVPSQCSAKVCGASFVPPLPTALQLVSLAHDTPFRLGTVEPSGLGLVSIDHPVPLQCSTKVCRPELVEKFPTA